MYFLVWERLRRCPVLYFLWVGANPNLDHIPEYGFGFYMFFFHNFIPAFLRISKARRAPQRGSQAIDKAMGQIGKFHVQDRTSHGEIDKVIGQIEQDLGKFDKGIGKSERQREIGKVL